MPCNIQGNTNFKQVVLDSPGHSAYVLNLILREQGQMSSLLPAKVKSQSHTDQSKSKQGQGQGQSTEDKVLHTLHYQSLTCE